MKYFGFNTSQQNVLGDAGVGGVSLAVGLAGNAIQANGGLNNTIAAFANAKSNIQWLFNGATTDDWFNFGITASTQVSAVAINTVVDTFTSPVSSTINLFTGQNINVNVTGSEVQSAVQSYVNLFQ